MLKKQLLDKIKSWIKNNKILDVIVFGSAVRGKSSPNDIDLCILINDKDEDKSIELVDSLGRLTDQFDFKFHINILASGAFVKGNLLAKTLLTEGYSIKNKASFSSVFGLKNQSLFVYTLSHFSSSERVKFHYMLKGRYGTAGVLKEVKGKFIGTGSITVPVENEDILKEVFDRWKVKYKISRGLFS